MRTVNWKRRNWCAAGILALYFLTNAIGLVMLRFSSAERIAHTRGVAVEIVGGLGVALAGLFVATCWFWARAKGWNGFTGVLAALVGGIFWAVSACFLLYPSVGQSINVDGPARVFDDRLPFLPWIAFIVSAGILRLLPVRQPKLAPPNAA